MTHGPAQPIANTALNHSGTTTTPSRQCSPAPSTASLSHQFRHHPGTSSALSGHCSRHHPRHHPHTNSGITPAPPLHCRDTALGTLLGTTNAPPGHHHGTTPTPPGHRHRHHRRSRSCIPSGRRRSPIRKLHRALDGSPAAIYWPHGAKDTRAKAGPVVGGGMGGE